MMQRLNVFAVAVIAGLTMWMIPTNAASASVRNGVAAAQAEQQQMPGPQTEEARSFVGKVVKHKGKYMLENKAAQVKYKLSDQADAKQYDGKHVKVDGSLDTTTNTIEVTKITIIQSGS